MKVISLINQKGGVGKSSATVNLATALSKLGKSVLVIDLDPQGDTTDYSNILEEQNLTTKELLLDKELKESLINEKRMALYTNMLADFEKRYGVKLQ
jgi:chromosome partitioning protein